MQFEVAKTAAIRPKQPRSGSLTMRSARSTLLECGRRALGAVREADSFRARAQQGASDEIARQITNANPRRLLAFMPKIKPMA
jgi:hypothetical protein